MTHCRDSLGGYPRGWRYSGDILEILGHLGVIHITLFYTPLPVEKLWITRFRGISGEFVNVTEVTCVTSCNRGVSIFVPLGFGQKNCNRLLYTSVPIYGDPVSYWRACWPSLLAQPVSCGLPWVNLLLQPVSYAVSGYHRREAARERPRHKHKHKSPAKALGRL